MMKKILLLGLLLGFVASLSSASRNTPHMEEELGRQCCTNFKRNPDGTMIKITACAGWALSNDERAMERACAKADEATPWELPDF